MLHIGFVSLLILITFCSVKCPLAPLAAIIQTCNCLLHRYINKPCYKSLYGSEFRSKKFPFSFVKLQIKWIKLLKISPLFCGSIALVGFRRPFWAKVLSVIQSSTVFTHNNLQKSPRSAPYIGKDNRWGFNTFIHYVYKLNKFAEEKKNFVG